MGVSKDLKMRYVAAAALAALGGQDVNEANIKKILSSVGIEADGEKVALVVKELAGKNLEEVIAAGTEKLGSVPSGGGAAAAASCCRRCRTCCRCRRRSSSQGGKRRGGR